MNGILILLPILCGVIFLVKVLVLLSKKRIADARFIFLLTALLFYIDIKLYYRYYNFVFHILLIGGCIFYWIKQPKPRKSFTTFSTLTIATINILLLFTPDENIYQYWNSAEIGWRKLNWSDFKGNPKQDSDSIYSALTNSGLKWKTNKTFNYPPAVVMAYMDTRESWKKAYINQDGFSDSLLLQHEQIHFDLYELSRKALVKKLRYRWGDSEDSLNHIIRTMAKRSTYAGKQYDIQTEHGQNQVVQRLWTNKMNAALSK